MQDPPLQTVPPVQVIPELPAAHVPVAPQYVGFVCGSTQVPLQLMRPIWQLTAHMPLLQTWPGAQVAPPAQPAVTPQ